MFTISKMLVNGMIEHARRGLPEEVCGLIGGTPDTGHVRREIANIAEHPRVQYRMNPAEQLRAMEAFEEAGWDMVAIYHSHPAGPARPSETDVAESYYPDTVYFIISFAPPDAPSITAWTIDRNGGVAPAQWRIADD